MQNKIFLEVDLITESVIQISTGESLETIFNKLDSTFTKSYKKKDWIFDWTSEYNKEGRELYMMTLKDSLNEILGLVSIQKMDDHVHVHLAESACSPSKAKKKFLGIGGNLFAFACKKSFEYGFQGNISFFSKTKLIRHYSVNLQAQHLGNGRMIIQDEPAKVLIRKYFNNEK